MIFYDKNEVIHHKNEDLNKKIDILYYYNFRSYLFFSNNELKEYKKKEDR